MQRRMTAADLMEGPLVNVGWGAGCCGGVWMTEGSSGCIGESGGSEIGRYSGEGERSNGTQERDKRQR